MPRFGKRSRAQLDTIRNELREIVEAVMAAAPDDRDFTVLRGRRGKADQNEAHAMGYSGAGWPDSAHNCAVRGPGPRAGWGEDTHALASAVDLAPWPIVWEDTHRFHHLAGRVLHEAARRGVPLVWGGDFKSLADLGHFELPG